VSVLEFHGSATSLLQERECLHQNNAFIHRLLKGRHARNTITHLCNEQGTKVEEIHEIKSSVEESYKNC